MSILTFPAVAGKPPAYTRFCRAVGRALFALAELARRLGLRPLADRLGCRALLVVQAGEKHRLGIGTERAA